LGVIKNPVRDVVLFLLVGWERVNLVGQRRTPSFTGLFNWSNVKGMLKDFKFSSSKSGEIGPQFRIVKELNSHFSGFKINKELNSGIKPG
jgi:hypothetical protein